MTCCEEDLSLRRSFPKRRAQGQFCLCTTNFPWYREQHHRLTGLSWPYLFNSLQGFQFMKHNVVIKCHNSNHAQVLTQSRVNNLLIIAFFVVVSVLIFSRANNTFGEDAFAIFKVPDPQLTCKKALHHNYTQWMSHCVEFLGKTLHFHCASITQVYYRCCWISGRE